jgi:Domain of unknown function (DUF4337)
MDASDVQDLKEKAEQVAQEATLRPVAFTMSVLAVLLAVTTVMGERKHAGAIIAQNQATDKWNEYQAQKIRDYNTQLTSDLLSVVALDNKDATAKIVKAYADHQKKWAGDLAQDQAAATALEAKVKTGEAQSDRYDLGEVLLEIGLVITSITLLTRSRIYWYLGIVASALGIAAAISSLFIK